MIIIQKIKVTRKLMLLKKVENAGDPIYVKGKTRDREVNIAIVQMRKLITAGHSFVAEVTY